MTWITRFMAVGFVIALTGQSLAHEYFHETPNRRGPPSRTPIHPGSTIEIFVGDSSTIVVQDRGTCSAEVSSEMAAPAIATLTTPATRTGTRVSVSFNGTSAGQTTLTIGVKGQGTGTDENGNQVSCTEDSTNQFTICVVPPVTTAEKAFKKRLAALFREFQSAMNSRVGQVRTANAQTLFDFQKGTIAADVAQDQLDANVTDVSSTLNDLWLAKAREGETAGREVLAELGIPPCATLARGFSWGGGGQWDQFNESLRLTVIAAFNNMKADAQGAKGKLDAAAAGGAEGATSSQLYFSPVPPSISAPADATPAAAPTVKKAVIVHGTNAGRPNGNVSGRVRARGTAEPNSQVVIKVTSATGADSTLTVTADANGNWSGAVTGVAPGTAYVSASYQGEQPSQQSVVTVR